MAALPPRHRLVLGYARNDSLFVIDRFFFSHCERSPAPHGVQGEVKQSQVLDTSYEI